MFDAIARQLEPLLEAERIAADSGTVAGLLAALYADPEHPQAKHLQIVPSVAGLQAAFHVALDTGEIDAACAIATELSRIDGEDPGANPATLFGSKAGLWRLH